jgi:hypothetical protein
MNVTRDVVRDLVVVYLTGEASEDTRRLVEEWLVRDPELAESVKSAGGFTVPHTTPPAGLEIRALDRTRKLLSRKNYLLWFSLLLTYLPLSFGYNLTTKHLTYVMFWDYPALAGVFLVLGIQGWIAFLYTCHQLQGTGLEPANSWGKRLAWGLGGMAVWFPIMTCLAAWTGMRLPLYLLVLFGLLGIQVGEKLGQAAR